MAKVGWNQHHLVSKGLTIHRCHGAGREEWVGGGTVRRFGWLPIAQSIERLHVSRDQLVAIARNDYIHPKGKRRFKIAMYEPVISDRMSQPRLYGVRASSGHSTPWLEYGEIMVPLAPSDTDHLPAMRHGTYWNTTPSILQHGLRPGRGEGG